MAESTNLEVSYTVWNSSPSGSAAFVPPAASGSLGHLHGVAPGGLVDDHGRAGCPCNGKQVVGLAAELDPGHVLDAEDPRRRRIGPHDDVLELLDAVSRPSVETLYW